MKLTYDPRHNMADIRFQGPKAEVLTLSLSDSVSVDIAPDGTACGVELLDANEQLEAEDGRRLVFVNEANGHRQDIALED